MVYRDRPQHWVKTLTQSIQTWYIKDSHNKHDSRTNMQRKYRQSL